jgi:hypothetical protein
MGRTEASHALPIHGTASLSTSFCPLPLTVSTPVLVSRLGHLLRDFPVAATVEFLLAGFTFGFDIGFRGALTDLNSRPRNLLSARGNVVQVSAAVAKEVSRGHTSGPFRRPPFVHTHCSPLGSAPKPDGSVRLLLDLSSPRGDSVNEGIDPLEFACKYSKFDDAVDIAVRLGRGAWLAKVDIQHAFRLCPVRPAQWPLLCFQWADCFFVDTRLPFGCRSSPCIFNSFAGALAWLFIHLAGVVYLIHYLDDFFFANCSFDSCSQDMGAIRSLCGHLGVPLAPDKSVGPSRCLTYLGIELDTESMSARLPPDKLSKLQALLVGWRPRTRVKKRELLSLIGFLSFACRVVRPGRMFLRRLIALSTSVTSLEFYVPLNAEARLDLEWWRTFLPQWNGVALLLPPPVSSRTLRLFTDASDRGFGCVFGTHWLLSVWRHGWGAHHINIRELFASWVAIRTWGDALRDTQVVLFTDSLAMTMVWSTGSCKDAVVMRIVRALFLFTARRNINLLLRHVPGEHNVLADSLSRFQVAAFKDLHATADLHPTVFSEDVWLV